MYVYNVLIHIIILLGIPIVQELEQEGNRMAGTLRLARTGIPRAIKYARLAKGECISRKRGNIMIQKWSDKKVVTFLSNAHPAQMVDGRHTDADGIY
jgi:hypothetical protein